MTHAGFKVFYFHHFYMIRNKEVLVWPYCLVTKINRTSWKEDFHKGGEPNNRCALRIKWRVLIYLLLPWKNLLFINCTQGNYMFKCHPPWWKMILYKTYVFFFFKWSFKTFSTYSFHRKMCFNYQETNIYVICVHGHFLLSWGVTKVAPALQQLSQWQTVAEANKHIATDSLAN